MTDPSFSSKIWSFSGSNVCYSSQKQEMVLLLANKKSHYHNFLTGIEKKSHHHSIFNRNRKERPEDCSIRVL